MAEKSLSRIRILKREADASRSKKSFTQTGKSHFSCFSCARPKPKSPFLWEKPARSVGFLRTSWGLLARLGRLDSLRAKNRLECHLIWPKVFESCGAINKAASNSPELSSRTVSANSYMAIYSNSKKKARPVPASLQRQHSGDFDDFNTVAKQSRRLKYRGPSQPSGSRSVSRSKRSRKHPPVRDFYEKLSQEFGDDQSDRSVSKGRSQRTGHFQSQWRGQSGREVATSRSVNRPGRRAKHSRGQFRSEQEMKPHFPKKGFQDIR